MDVTRELISKCMGNEITKGSVSAHDSPSWGSMGKELTFSVSYGASRRSQYPLDDMMSYRES
ncbi:Hypothetical protein FKW44_001425, partial [Caligus rogercresseyi]